MRQEIFKGHVRNLFIVFTPYHAQITTSVLTGVYLADEKSRTAQVLGGNC